MAKGIAAYRAGAAARAYAILRPLADAGQAEAQFYIALIFLEGKVLPVDLADARRWAQRAVSGGHGPAAALLQRIEAAQSRYDGGGY